MREYFVSRKRGEKEPPLYKSALKSPVKSPAKPKSPEKVKSLKDTIMTTLRGNMFNGLVNPNSDVSVAAKHEDNE